MLAFLSNIGPFELILIGVVAVLIFGKDLPQAASKAYLQVRKLRSAVDDLRRDTGIERELRNIERTVREAEWEARRTESVPASLPRASTPPATVPPAAVPPPSAPQPSEPPAATPPPAEDEKVDEPPAAPTGGAAS